jgi:hypothetical protein
MTVRTFLLDDHTMFREGLLSILPRGHRGGRALFHG